MSTNPHSNKQPIEEGPLEASCTLKVEMDQSFKKMKLGKQDVLWTGFPVQ